MTNNEDQILSLVRKRGQVKAKLTSFKDFLQRLAVPDESGQLSEVNLIQLQSRFTTFENLLEQFEKINEMIISLETEENIEKRITEFCNFENDFYELISAAKIMLSKNSPNGLGENQVDTTIHFNSHSSINSANNHSTAPINSNSQINVQLPVLKIQTYKGEPEQFLCFFETFKSLVHNNEKLDDISRFLYLKSCLGSEPLKVIESLEVSAANYEIALGLIEKRYKNTKLTIHAHIKGIVEYPKITKESASSLRQFCDSLQAHLRALESLGEPVESWSTIIQYLVTDKLDYQSKKEWEIESSKLDNDPRHLELIEFLEKRCALLEKIEKHPKPTYSYNQNSFKPKSNTKTPTFTHVTTNYSCYLCKGNHKIYSCKKFLELPIPNRKSEVRRLNLCSNCLNSGHTVEQCKSSHCKHCSIFHSSLLHLDEANTNNVQASTSLTSCVQSPKSAAEILPTAIIQIVDSDGKPHQCVALLDSCSMKSYMTVSLCNKLKLNTHMVNVSVSGINQSKSKATSIANSRIGSMHTNFSADVSFLIIQNITDYLPPTSLHEPLEIPDNIPLANPNFDKFQRIDVLLGVGIFWQLLLTDQPFSSHYPYLHNTLLGYVVSGEFATNSTDISTSCHLSTVNLSKQLRQFWEIENISAPKPLSSEDRYCETHFAQTTTRDNHGKFVVSLPLGSSPDTLGESKESARRQFLSLEKRLSSNPKLKTLYVDFMKEYHDLGHMRAINDFSKTAFQYYIPHHCIHKEHSLTTKLRVVFNSSAPSSTGVSLNDIQLNGPVLQNDLFTILARFRRFKYAISADCSKMYRSIWVEESQQPLQRIFWREDPSHPLQVFELCTVTYGEKASSFLAIRCLFELANECEISHPEITAIIKNDMYCDDLLTSCSNLQEASNICHNISRILQSGGFTLRKWSCNYPEVLNTIESSDVSNNILKFGPSENTRTLGLQFNTYSDNFFYTISQYSGKSVTKRVVLSFISMIFDPLGLINPCTIVSKMLMQDLWLAKVGWDDPLPTELQAQWNNYIEHLPSLNSCRIPRQVICDNYQRLELHAFSDSSQKAYGTCLYIRSFDNKNNVFVNLLCSKTKVSPLKTLTIPKLELCGAIMMAQLVDKVKKGLGIAFKQIVYWTDSTIVLAWIKTEPHLLDTFTSNRVSQIQDVSNPSQWYYIPTDQNPSDLLTRGVSPEKLQNLQIWWHGPSFLSKANAPMPAQIGNYPPITSNISETETPSTSFIASNSSICLFPFKNFSKFNKLVRVMAYCIRFYKNCQTASESRIFGPLKMEELRISSMLLASLSQRESFPEEYKQISLNKSINKRSKLASLTPFLDTDKTIRVCGRLKNSVFNYDKKHPIIIDASHQFAKLLFANKHEKLLHAGPQQLLSSIREEYWPICGRNLAKKTVFNCVVCFKSRPRDIQNLLGHLPKERITQQFPFSVTGTDYCGPFQIKDRKGRGFKVAKCWVCLFVCFCTKAVHLEPVTDLSSESFMLCLRRFASRRGMPVKLYSDNGRTYVGAHNELNDLGSFLIANQDDLKEQFANNNFNWSFLPAYSPNMGGLWEAGIKSFKYHLKRVLNNSVLTYEHFYSVVVQIEAVLNSRPLSPLSSCPEDLLPLTPAHFLAGRPLTTVPDPDLHHIPEPKLSNFQRLQHITQSFWSRWSKEFISELQQRFKWKTYSSNIQLDTLVLLKDDGLPPTKWKLGRVIELHHGSDKVVRVVSVRTAMGITRRAISRICPLPIDTSPPSDVPSA